MPCLYLHREQTVEATFKPHTKMQLQPMTAIVLKLFIATYLHSSFFIHLKKEHCKVSSLSISCNINEGAGEHQQMRQDICCHFGTRHDRISTDARLLFSLLASEVHGHVRFPASALQQAPLYSRANPFDTFQVNKISDARWICTLNTLSFMTSGILSYQLEDPWV